MNPIDTREMNWLETKGNFSRYDTMEPGDSISIWVCDDCGEEIIDPDEDDHDCCVVDRLSDPDPVDEDEEDEDEEDEAAILPGFAP